MSVAGPRSRERFVRPLDRAAAVLCRPKVVGGALVGAVALVRVLPLAAVEDLRFSDDATYLRNGVWMRRIPLSGAQSPVFAAWYWVTTHVFSRVQSQFVTYLVLGAALGLVVYWLAVALGARRGPAALAALALTGTALPVVRPTVGTFTAVVVGATVAAAWRVRRRPEFWPILTVGTALAAWTRPEFLVALVAVVLLAGVSVLVGPGADDRRRSLLALGACLLVVGLGWGVLGSPVAGGRQWVAFCQHEGFARSSLGESDIVAPWHDWRQVCRGTYGTDTTIGAAIVHHPGAVAAHVGRSLRLAPRSLGDALFRGHGRETAARSGLAVAAGAGLLAGALAVVVRRRRRLGARIRAAGLPGMALVALLVPNAVSIVVIHPRFHYLAWPAVLVMAVAAVAVSRSRVAAARALVVLVGALLVTVVVGAAVVEAADPPVHRPVLEAIAALQERADTDGLDRVVSAGADITGYVKGVATVSVPATVGTAGDLARWLDARHIDGVVDIAAGSEPTRNGPLPTLARDPERYGWRRVALPGRNALLVPVGADG